MKAAMVRSKAIDNMLPTFLSVNAMAARIPCAESSLRLKIQQLGLVPDALAIGAGFKD
jgi:hypothetical protein